MQLASSCSCCSSFQIRSQFSMMHLFFGLDAALEIDLCHFFRFIGTIVVFVLVHEVFLVFTVIAQHTILDIGTNRIPTTLCWEADFAKHARMLVNFAKEKAYLPIFHGKNSCRIAVAAFHKVNQTVSETRLYLSNVFPCGIAHK